MKVTIFKIKFFVGLFVRYYSQCMFQHTGMELGDNLKACIANALQTYKEVNGALPERIIVYRDGVGDGQVRKLYCFLVHIKQLDL